MNSKGRYGGMVSAAVFQDGFTKETVGRGVKFKEEKERKRKQL
jgi:hypothetical protein